MWTLRSGTSDAGDRIFSRPLGDTEVSFHWDGAFSGTADCIMHQNIEISHDARHQVTKDSFRQAWLALKRRFPILGAQVEERESGTILEFVVNESCLSDIGPGEMGFLEGGADVASQVVEDALNGPRKLSNNLHASIVIIQPQGERLTFHVVVIVAHVITDGMGNSTLIRNFLEGLASSDRTAPPDLPGRLAMAMCSESLAPTLALSHARRRWRNAIARIIWQRSQSALQGGHGLPGRRSPQTTTTPAISKQASIILLPSLSQAVIKSCRAHSITFGHAFPVIAQLALSRSLHRRYLRGEIPEEEWQYRLRQPTHTGGPLNLRPFLKKEWVAAGGEHELNIHINFFFITLPRMAQSSLGAESDFSGAPSFSSLLSPQRFFLRCELVKRQMSQYMKHPLFYEVISQRGPIYAERKRNIALLWRRRQAGEPISPEEIAATTGVDGGLVLAHGGSSRGNVDKSLPLEYPAPREQKRQMIRQSVHADPTSTAQQGVQDRPMVSSPISESPPHSNSGQSSSSGATYKLRVLSSAAHLRCRPTELYLGSSTSRGQMKMFVHYDGNVYDNTTVREWLEDVKDATTWYLGGQAGGESATDEKSLEARL